MTVGDIASLIIALGTVGSLLYISRQVNVARLQAKGQFLLALDAQFEKFTDISMRFVNEENFTPQGSEWIQIWGLMSVFERINIMVEDKILDVALVDRLHGFRLLIILSNDAIFHRIQAAGSEWQDFIDLCYAVAEHRHTPNMTPAEKTFYLRVQQLTKTTRSRNPFGFDAVNTNSNP